MAEPTAVSMRLLLDRDAVSPQTAETAHLVMELVPGEQGLESRRPPLSIIFVLDISSSMSGPPLEHVKGSVEMLLDLLDGGERVGVVAFSDSATEVAPLRPLEGTIKTAIKSRVRRLEADGCTNLAAGLELARTMLGPRGVHERQLIIALTDGQPNRGVADADGLSALVSSMRPDIVTVTMGYGPHHADDLLARMAAAGSGEYFYIANPLEADHAFARAVSVQSDVVADAVEITLSPGDGVDIAELVTRVPSKISRHGLVLTHADLLAKRNRYVVARLALTPPAALGPWPAMDVTLRYRRAGESEVIAVTSTLEIPVMRRAGVLLAEPYARVLLAEAERARAEARALADREQYSGAAAVMRDMIQKIEAAPGFQPGGSSVLADAYEQLIDERMAYERKPSKEDYSHFKRMSLGVDMQDGGWHHSERDLASDKAKRIAGGARGDLPPAFFEVLRPGQPVLRVLLTAEFTIGRVAGNNLVLPSGGISKRHTRVVGTNGAYMVMDLHSTNGTIVNGQRIHAPHMLKPGDEIALGEAILRYQEEPRHGSPGSGSKQT